jgi:hypothetical protein
MWERAAPPIDVYGYVASLLTALCYTAALVE